MKNPRPDGNLSANDESDFDRILPDWMLAVHELYECYHQLSRLLTDDESISYLPTANRWSSDDLRRLQLDACIQLVELEQDVNDRDGKPNQRATYDKLRNHTDALITLNKRMQHALGNSEHAAN